jgi:hypothetical protein
MNGSVRPRSAAADAPSFASYHEIAMMEAARRRQARTGIVALIAIVAVGWFTPDPGSFYAGAILTIVLGIILRRVA